MNGSDVLSGGRRSGCASAPVPWRACGGASAASTSSDLPHSRDAEEADRPRAGFAGAAERESSWGEESPSAMHNCTRKRRGQLRPA